MTNESRSAATKKQHDRIYKALTELARKAGLTPARIQSLAPWLIEDLGVDNAQAARELILRTLETLDLSRKYRYHNGELYILALRNAFGEKDSPKTLEKRRVQHAYVMGLTRHGVAHREKLAREALADALSKQIGNARR